VRLLKKIRSHSLNQLIFTLGTKAGVPYPVLQNCADVLDIGTHLPDYLRRRRYARALAREIPECEVIPRNQGYLRVGQGVVPGVEQFVASCRQIWAEEADRVEFSEKEAFTQVMKPEHFRRFPP
jgi:hypothetical protein